MEGRDAKRRRSGSAEASRCSPASGACARHRAPPDFYCRADQHRGHAIGCVTEERRREQKELWNLQAKSKQILRTHEQRYENMGETLKRIQEAAGETRDYCESVLVGLIDSLQRHYMSLRELIGRHEDEAAAQVQDSLQTLQGKMEDMRTRDAELDRLARTDSDLHFLQEWPSMQRLCKEDHRHPLHEDSEDPLHPFEMTKRAVDQLGEQLERIIDRKFALISAGCGEQWESEEESEEDDMQQRFPSGVPNMTEHNTEPQTRAEFLQYACRLRLDPSTAHEDLAVSAGDREVRLRPSGCKSPSVRYPLRFLHRRQLLCREGLRAERCYYEVEVEGGKAEIALAYKGMDRKSLTKLSAFGGNEKSWSLDRAANHYSVSHRSESVQLTRPPGQRRLGVYLNLEEGTLSFYEVSDEMVLLYKVEAKFTEPLYPGFWLGENCCIRIAI